MRKSVTSITIILCLLLGAATALAHGVKLYGYVEKGYIKGEGYFAGGAKAQRAKVELHEFSGKLLASTTTDREGRFSIKIPNADPPLKLVLKAGPGHQGVFVLSAEDLGLEQPVPGKKPGALPIRSSQSQRRPQVDPAQLQAAVARALDAKLAPINRKLAELSADKGVSTRDIIAGIGYILGLFGVYAWAASRRKKD